MTSRLLIQSFIQLLNILSLFNMATIRIGKETEDLLRAKFIETEHLSSSESEYGKFGFIDKKVNSDWHTFLSGAINMLKVQHSIIEK